MSRRALILLAAAVVVLTLLAQLGSRDTGPADSEQGAAFVPELEEALNEVERVTLLIAGETPAATLERRADEWVVIEKDGYRADVGKLRTGLRALAEARILEPKTANPTLHSRLGVEDLSDEMAAGLAVSFTASGRTLPTVILGNAEGSSYRYARRAGEPQSFLIDQDPDLPRNPSQWVDPEIVDLRGTRVQQVTITHPDETVTISKATPDAANFAVADVPEGRELLYAGVANVVGNALRELKLEDVARADPSAAAESDAVVVEFRTFDGLVLVARGMADGEQSWLTFAASYDPEQAARFADAAEAVPATDEPDADAATDAAAAPDAAGDVTAEAAAINARTQGWRYQIASYQYDQLTRRMSDLLQPPSADE
jgi:hypothetical protein